MKQGNKQKEIMIGLSKDRQRYVFSIKGERGFISALNKKEIMKRLDEKKILEIKVESFPKNIINNYDFNQLCTDELEQFKEDYDKYIKKGQFQDFDF